MPVELRKRKAPTEPEQAPPKKAASRNSSKAPAAKASASKAKEPAPKKPAASSSDVPKTGETIELSGFGGTIETNDGDSTTLKQLVDGSKGGVVLLAYPKASTPGCTTQVCLARDAFDEITSTGFSIFGISRDSPKANTTFKTKQNLPYALLCDKEGTLISAVGLKKAPSGTQRGVFVIDKNGKVLAAQAGGPKETVEIVKKLASASQGDLGDKIESEAKSKAGKSEKKVDSVDEVDAKEDVDAA